ncbi:hypothetical protein GCM10008995_26270 [Halobellus salinus]|uniref:Uncharacterized protein n=1 Tax=Halobellus salinus TaxID=931585 RepID=A0A830EDI6_9EURY|nr:hypothetical protein [Halobellus salinus]GGJ15198.1 hypothetical protein GCM10008995_26270 [Halobellus salinus]SMP32801.1 hypothetical protein SAMN06265347_12133 [Halobellus salinus]
MNLLRVATKLHHYRLPTLGVCGLAMTLALSGPGVRFRTIGPLRLDMFYASVVVCGLLVLSVAVLGEYDPEAYGLEP